MLLMNKDTEVLEFSLEDMFIRVINNNFLPFELKDYIETTNPSNFKKSVNDFSLFKDFLSSRVILLSRENAKTILNVTALPQTLKMEDRLKIVKACSGLSMIDNFWIKYENDDRMFSDVNLRTNKLSSVCYDIAVLGKNLSATSSELIPELSTLGMSPKCWVRDNNRIRLLKTDKLKGLAGTSAEIKASEILSSIGANVVRYEKLEKDDLILSLSDCISTDDLSLVHAGSVVDWCNHTNRVFIDFVFNNFKKDFCNMVVADYIVANTDRHAENWGFLVDSKNRIVSMSPLYDFDLALLIDETKGNIDELVYGPTGLTYKESIDKYAKYSDLNLCNANNTTENINRRLKTCAQLMNPLERALSSMFS